MSKKYELSFVLGRFQVFHNGHKSIIEEALKISEKAVILVGSSSESRTKKNPFTFEERKRVIEECFQNVKIVSLKDIGVGDCEIWGDYLIENVSNVFDKKPEVFVCGNDSKVDKWFSDEALKSLKIFKIDRKILNTSASELRSAIIENNKEYFCKNTPLAVHKYYDFYKDTLKNIEQNT